MKFLHTPVSIFFSNFNEIPLCSFNPMFKNSFACRTNSRNFLREPCHQRFYVNIIEFTLIFENLSEFLNKFRIELMFTCKIDLFFFFRSSLYVFSVADMENICTIILATMSRTDNIGGDI